MFDLGQVVVHQGQFHVVVMVNDCRAIIVPLNGRSMDDPQVIFQETDQGHQNISPEAQLKRVGRVAGRIVGRPTIPRKSAVPSPVEPPAIRPAKVIRSLKHILKPVSSMTGSTWPELVAIAGTGARSIAALPGIGSMPPATPGDETIDGDDE